MYYWLQGITVKFGANDRHFKGNLIAYLGDTPAAALAGGFKEGAYRCCRSYMIKNDELCSQVNEVFNFSISF